MDLLFDTICNFRYNREKRERLTDEHNTIQEEYRNFINLYDEEIENDKENERIYQKMQEAEQKLRIASLRCLPHNFRKLKTNGLQMLLMKCIKIPLKNMQMQETTMKRMILQFHCQENKYCVLTNTLMMMKIIGEVLKRIVMQDIIL